MNAPATLVFTSAFGDAEYFLCAEEMIRSLRAAGYGGRVVALTDRPHAFGGDTETVVVREPSYVPYKTLLHRYVDLAGCGKILFADSDILFFRNPDPLFEACTDRLLVAPENIAVGRNPHNIRCFSREQRLDGELMKSVSINSGSLVFPSPEHYAACAETWRAEWEAWGQFWDQPPLQLLLATGRLEFGCLPPPLFALPLLPFERRPLTPDMVFAHLCGYPHRKYKERVLEGMLRLGRCGDNQTRRRLISSLRAECHATYRARKG